MGAKVQAFELQRQKYQARYNDATDEVTAATAELARHSPSIQGIQTNLQLLGKAIEARVSALVAEHTINYPKLIQNTILFKPVFRLFKKAGILVIIGIVVFFGSTIWKALIGGLTGADTTELVFWLFVVFAIQFYFERRAQLKGAMDVLHKNGAKLKELSLAYIYDDQVAQAQTGAAAYHLIRIFPDTAKAPEEFMIAPVSWGVNMRPDSFLLYVSDIAVYRAEKDGNLALVFVNAANLLMAYCGTYLNQALLEQKSFAAGTLEPLAAYGKAAWRKRKATQAVPELEKLVRNVDRIENVWRSVAVGDKAIDFLLKRIDSFNMRERATPPGILLYGSQGNGKTFLAKKIAESIGANFVPVDASTLTSADAVRSIWQASRSQPPSVLFVESAERVFPAAGSQQQGVGTQAAAAWVTEWNRFDADVSRVWVVISAASDSDKEIDWQILNRFGSSKTEIGSPDDAGRELILRQACRDNHLPTVLPSWQVEEARGMGVRDLIQMVGEAKLQSSPNLPDDAVWRKSMRVVRDPSGSWDPRNTWDNLILPAPIMQQLKTACRIVREAERYKEKGAEVPNILLYGPPGTGKTQVARTLANEARVPCKTAGTADLKGTHIGDSAKMVKDKFLEARGAAPSILFIDEIETSAADRSSSKSDQYTHEIVTQMLQEMDGIVKNDNKPVFVLAATNIKEDIDPAILSRFTFKIEISLPDEAARKQLVKIEISKTNAADPSLDIDEIAGVLAQKTARKAGRDLRQLVSRAMQRAVSRSNSPDDFSLTREDLLSEFPKENTEDLEKLWDRLILPSEIKEQLWTARRIIRDGDRYKAKGAEIPNILLYGPPGTGKTEIARTLAKLGGVGFVSGTTADMKGNHIGDSAKMVKDKFKEARDAAPAVLFIDELESLATSRTSSKSDVYTQEIVTEMLQQMNGVKEFTSPVVILAATNLPEEIDEAIKSRFSNQISIPLPDENGRCQILKNLISERPLAPGLNVNVDQLAAEMAKATNGRAGRDLLMLVNRAMQRAVSASKSADDLHLTADDLLGELKPKDVSISEEQLQQIWAEIVLRPDIKEAILSKIRLFNRGGDDKPKGLLLYGPPGTGKTEIARCIQKSTGSYFMNKKAADLKAGYTGQSGNAVKALWEEAKAHGRTVMFIDECDAVFSQRTSMDTDSFVKEIVNTFIAYWDGVETGQSSEVWVVGATNHKEVLDEAVMSRFGTAIEIMPPDAAGRLEILRLEMKKAKRDVTIPAFLGEATTGLSGRDLKLLAQGVRELAGDPKNEISEQRWRTVVDHLKGGRSDAVAADARWDSLVLPDAMLKKFKTTCRALRQIEAIKKQGIAPPRAILLYGKPGTGKTQIARTMANESGVTFIAAGPSDLKAGWVGQSAPKVHSLFERARSEAPCILFIDELDSAFPKRGGAQTDQFTTEIVNQALTELDGVKKNDRFVFLLGATNRPELIDDAILSRFPDKMEVPYPDANERVKILQVLIGKKPVDFDVAAVAAELAGMTANFSGRDLWSLVENASQAALTRALDTDEAKADELKIVMSREDLIAQIASVPSQAGAGETGMPAGT